MSAFILLALVVIVNSLSWMVFVLYDIKQWLDGKDETETASSVIRRWMRASPWHLTCIMSAIGSLAFISAALVVYLWGHFPAGWW